MALAGHKTKIVATIGPASESPQLEVERVAGGAVETIVRVGGELRSHKGLNLPGIDLGVSAFTEHDHACLAFALRHGVDAVSQSFVETAADVEAVRAAAAACGARPFVIAKIERSSALRHVDEILAAADGIMIARGDLGVEVPIEEIALIQKDLIAKATLAGRSDPSWPPRAPRPPSGGRINRRVTPPAEPSSGMRVR